MGKLVLSSLDNTIFLFFQVQYPVTGVDNARLIITGVSSMDNIIIGIPYKASFDAEWSLSFNEAINVYHKSDDIGDYTGEGILCDNKKCNFKFTSELFAGKWKIDHGIISNADTGLFAKFHKNKGGIRVTRIQ